MTQDELNDHWVGALVKRDDRHEVGRVVEVRAYSGQLVLDVAWAGGECAKANASGVSILGAKEVQVAYVGWQDALRDLRRLRSEMWSAEQGLRRAREET